MQHPPPSPGSQRILAFDPGALRAGWAVLGSDEDGYYCLDSGVLGLERDGMAFQEYRAALIEAWHDTHFPYLLGTWRPRCVACEQLPPVGSGNFIQATQAELAKAVATTIEVCCLRERIPFQLIHAGTVKKAVVGRAGSRKSGKVTKEQVRDAVWAVLPHLAVPRSEWVADETDAIAVALCAAGYRKPKKGA